MEDQLLDGYNYVMRSVCRLPSGESTLIEGFVEQTIDVVRHLFVVPLRPLIQYHQDDYNYSHPLPA